MSPAKARKFSPEVRSRAVRMVLEHEKDHPSRWATVCSVAAKIGCTAQTLHEWIMVRGQDLASYQHRRLSENTGAGLTVTDAARGMELIQLAPGDTSGLGSRRVQLYFELEVEVAGAVYTIATGRMVVEPDVTVRARAPSLTSATWMAYSAFFPRTPFRNPSKRVRLPTGIPLRFHPGNSSD